VVKGSKDTLLMPVPNWNFWAMSTYQL
jgi:hypothetical protein